MIDDLWYKNGVFYCLCVGTYMDANGDGIGDFKGAVAASRLSTLPFGTKEARLPLFHCEDWSPAATGPAGPIVSPLEVRPPLWNAAPPLSA
jgi:hypothetical protein